jgi:tetratricopeptide (TPR) repeat protein
MRAIAAAARPYVSVNRRLAALGGLADGYQADQIAWGHPRRGIELYARALEHGDIGSTWTHRRAIKYLRVGEPEKALIDVERLIVMRPQRSDGWDVRGRAHQALGRHDRAIEDYTRAIEFEPANAEFYEQRARSYADTGRLDDAAADRARARELSSGRDG